MTPAEYTLDLCDRIAAHTDVPGTITRTFLSPATANVHTLLRVEMEALGMSVRTDSVGNVRGIYPAQIKVSSFAKGGGPASVFPTPTLLTGSHIDTVPDAGRYDGILGVALPLALIRSLDGKKLPYAIEIIAFSEEEGVRFKLPFIGSRALIGDLTPADFARTDADGITIAQAIANYFSGAPSQSAPSFEVGTYTLDLADSLLTPNTFAFFESHIEQGPVLESLNLPLGIVTTIIGQSRFDLTFHGHANHAGTTPMHLRSDALAAAAAFIVATEAMAGATAGLVATVGFIEASPGAANVIPGIAICSLDIRHTDDATRHACAQLLLDQARQAAQNRGVTLTFVDRTAQASVPMDAALRDALTSAAAPFAPHAMPSGAGHDAMILARKVPSAMLFLRTPGGLSHHPDEAVSAQDVAAALATGLRFLEALSYHGPHNEGAQA